MSFTPDTFSPIGANSTESFAVYAYKTTDTINDVSAVGYFVAKKLQLNELDIIHVIASDGLGFFSISSDTSTGILQISSITAGAVTSVNGQTGAVIGLEETVNKSVANGYASLDGGATVPLSELPASVIGEMTYKGLWNATTNTPTLADGTGDNGDIFLVNVGGTINLGSGNITFLMGDQVIYDGNLVIWQKFGHATPSQVQSDWTESDSGAATFILNKPTFHGSSPPADNTLIWYNTNDNEWYYFDSGFALPDVWLSTTIYCKSFGRSGNTNNNQFLDYVGGVLMSNGKGPAYPFDTTFTSIAFSRTSGPAGNIHIRDGSGSFIENFPIGAVNDGQSPPNVGVLLPVDTEFSPQWLGSASNNMILDIYSRRVVEP